MRIRTFFALLHKKETSFVCHGNYAYDKAQNKAQKSQMSDREYILLLLKENPSLTQVELSEMMDKSRRTVQMLMKELLEEGAIERIGSKKNGSWLVK